MPPLSFPDGAAVPSPGTEIAEVVIGSRFNGPEQSANGGYACGILAGFLPEPAEITLRLPPPLEKPLRVVTAAGDSLRLMDGERLVAEGHAVAEADAVPPVRPPLADSQAATALHPFRGVRHPLSDCFVCGPERATPGDGLGVSPGPLPGEATVFSAPFVPDESVAEEGVVRREVVWAALDCPSYPPVMWGADRIALLGRMRARREREIRAGEELVAVGWSIDREGRKHQTGSALIDPDGEVVAHARATWIEMRS